METHLVKYEAARAALEAAHRVDEVKDIRDKAQAIAAYARQARDTKLVEWATEIKVRAERKCGEMLRDSAETGQRATRGGDGSNQHKNGANVVSRDISSSVTLPDLGLTRDQSSRYQKLAAMPEEHFETAIATAKATVGEVTTAYMLRQAATADAPTAKPIDIGRPCIGLQLAWVAVRKLEQIAHNDVERLEAMRYVKRWIEENAPEA